MVILKVRDIMTKNVAWVDPTSTVEEAAQLMQKHNIGAIPVCDRGNLLGIVTDRDIVVRNVAHGKNARDTSVKDVMTTQVTSVTPDMDVKEASGLMSSQQIRRVPVVEGSQIIGIVSLGDMAADRRFDTEASKALTDISRPSKPENMQ